MDTNKRDGKFLADVPIRGKSPYSQYTNKRHHILSQAWDIDNRGSLLLSSYCIVGPQVFRLRNEEDKDSLQNSSEQCIQMSMLAVGGD